jgi:hypothetical protein
MFPLRFPERCALAALGAAACTAALAISVNDARGAAGVAVPRGSAARAGTSVARGDVLPMRDPFGGDPALVSPAPASPPARVVPFPILGSVPVTAPPAFAQGATGTRVTATVTGAHPYAVLEGGGGSARIVTVGDTIGASSVVAIDAEGLHLADGTTISVAHPGRVRQQPRGDRSP